MIIDLSHRLDAETPVYPGDPKLTITQADTIESAGYLGHTLSLGTHLGTHIDAPAHMLDGGRSLDTYTVDRFVGPGKYIFVPDNTFSLELVQNADIQEGDIVLFHTNMSYSFTDPAYFTNYPAMPEAVAEHLVQKKVQLVGVDTCSIDNQDGFPIHKILLGADIPIIENLTNLEQLDGQTFRVYALPLRFDLDGAPARVIADLA